MSETFVTSGPLRLWTERTGNPDHPAVLLIAGASAQGLTFPDALVDRLVVRGVQVIRFDHRDTGRSSIIDFDRHPYGLSDLATDALAILNAYELPSANVAGASMGGVIAQWLAVHEPARVRSLTLLSSTPMGHDPGPVTQRAMAGQPADPDDLPPPTPRYLQYLADSDGTPPGVVADIAIFRVMNGDVRPFDEPAVRAMLQRCWARATDPSAAAHHGLIGRMKGPDLLTPLSTISAPTTVVHGDQDPIFTLAHGEALAAAIPDAHLHVVPGMGHVYFSPGLPEELADLISVHTRDSAASRVVMRRSCPDFW
ncbi:alpha/beta fold hydrolase [Kribbella sp. NPDC026596]|uniref:alpha/beta fold hydrolase n=1 Tax=Kribbella sp. NPDC026596 TaxID=3155122 RepID=UPI0033E2725F